MTRFKVVSASLLLLGSFVITACLLGRFYAYDRLAVIPADQNALVIAQTPTGQDATIFDMASLSKRTTPLRSTVLVTGDVTQAREASRATGRDAVVWQKYTCIDVPSFDCGSGEIPLSAALDLTAYDRHTA